MSRSEELRLSVRLVAGLIVGCVFISMLLVAIKVAHDRHDTEKMAAVMTTQKTKRRRRHVLIFEVMLLKHFADSLSVMFALCREWIAAHPSYGEP